MRFDGLSVNFISLTSSVLLAEVREPPNVAQTHGIANHRQHELDLVVPAGTLLLNDDLAGGSPCVSDLNRVKLSIADSRGVRPERRVGLGGMHHRRG